MMGYAPARCQLKRSIVITALVVLALSCSAASSRELRDSTPVMLIKGIAKSVHGVVKGYDFYDYQVRASAGQTLTVNMLGSNRANYFNINPPEAGDVSMYVGSVNDNSFSGLLPVDGIYVVRVYLMRSAARRQEHSDYSLTLKLDGEPLQPVARTHDALIPGTKYHAQATIKCTTVWSNATECPAFVVRYSFNGSATVEVRVTDSIRRRILFIDGKPTAADSTFPITYSKDADIYDIRFDVNERYSFPEALIFGG